MTPPEGLRKIASLIPHGYIFGTSAGLLAGYTRLHPAWAPAQILALATLAWALGKSTGITGRLRPGAWFGASMATLVLLNVGIPIPAAAILLGAFTLYWMGLGACIAYLLKRGGLRGVFGAAGLLTLGEWAQSESIPLFGTAQRMASAWVDYDAMLPASRAAGTLGVTFATGFIAFEITRKMKDYASKTSATGSERANSRPKGLWRDFQIIGYVIVTILLIVGSALLWLRKGMDETYGEKLTVAVYGSKSGAGSGQDEFFFRKKYLPALREAAERGAALFVTPEMGIFVKDSERDSVLERLAEEAQKLNIAWVVGYSQSGPSLNRAVLLNGDDRLVGESYDKTHWVPFLETYARHGDARAVTGLVRGVKVGVMICQDDNYESVARNLSLAGAQIVAVPTFDWKGVEFAHLNSARNRPREFGFVEARAAIAGVSAIIAPSGELLASRNELIEKPALTLATVNIDGGAPTLFARYGSLPILLISALLLANALRRRNSVADTEVASPGGTPARSSL